MTRDIGALKDEIAKPVLAPFCALYVDLPDPVRAWSGIGDLIFGGHTWSGVGSFGSFASLAEASDGTSSRMSFALSGIEPDFYQYLIEQPYRNALVEFWIGALDETFTKVAVDPKLFYRGRLTAVDLQDGDQIAIQITVERSSRDQMRQRVRRYTDSEQQRRHSGDKFFEYISQMQAVKILWGREG